MATNDNLDPSRPSSLTDPLDAAQVAHALAQAIRHRTVSISRTSPVAADEFEGLHDELKVLFPRVHSTLERERIGRYGLLYSWPGQDPDAEAIVLVAHQDVVPVEPDTDGEWSQPPFGGEIVGGEVWGRGALDDKGSLIAILAAVEDLLGSGFEPRRPLLLAFGDDEEVGGGAGAAAIAAELERREVRAAMVLDEGGAVADDILPGVGPVALVGIAEKGAVRLQLVVEGAGGHASMPPRRSTVGILAEAVQALERRPPRARLIQATRATLEALAPEVPRPLRLVLGHLDLFAPFVLRAFAKRPELDASVRTTTAVTVIRAGAKANAIPESARAVADVRILPGETVAGVVAHARDAIDDDRVRVSIDPETVPRDPGPTSPVDGPAFRLLEETVNACFHDAVVAPYLVLGGTDARHYAGITDAIYRFLPLYLDAAARACLHGTDERIPIADLAGAVRFYRELIRRAQVLL